jgi:hypothetical protein
MYYLFFTGTRNGRNAARDFLKRLKERTENRDKPVSIPWPFPAEPMRMWPISARVNKPENDDFSIVEPIELIKTAV